MKWDFAIGNPAYQAAVEETSDNRTFAAPVYNHFLDEAFKVADKVEMIHPARFLFNAGSTPKAWNEKMLNNPHYKVLSYEEDAAKVFSNTEIKGGIAITYYDKTQTFGAISVFTKYVELNSIMNKVDSATGNGSLASIIYTQNRFDLGAVYASHPQLKNIIGSEGKDKRFRNNIFEKIPLFMEEPTSDTDVAVIGVIKNKRAWRYIGEKYIDLDHENLNSWKVIVPRANGKGVISDVLSSPVVIAPNQAYTQTFLGIGAFKSKAEAECALKYIKSKFARAMLSILKVDQHNEKDTWAKVPLQDFTKMSDINWATTIYNIDKQLYKKYGLSQEEINFIETKVKEME